ncbi:MAG: NAD-dependent epimerase/dehydratase family protein, partial [Actinobacteria bacterium]
MRVAITGASGLIGTRLGGALRARGDEVVAVSLRSGAPSPEALSGCDAVVNLAGEPIAQRWTGAVRERIRASRVEGTRALVDALAAAEPRPRVLVNASGVGYYGARGEERVDEDAPPGDDFLAQVCLAWEREAQAAADHDVRVVIVRTGVVLAKSGGALAKMLPPFRLGVGGPVAG